jgi:hypothetical protein
VIEAGSLEKEGSEENEEIDEREKVVVLLTLS